MRIVEYFNSNKKLPEVVDTSASFEWYKINTSRDTTFDYFMDYNKTADIEYVKDIDYDHEHQYLNYSQLDYTGLNSFIKKYFSPSNEIEEIIECVEKKYNIDYDNTCVLFYRGNDKNRETRICDYDEYIKVANKIREENPGICFLIQSDETEFIEKMFSEFPNNTFCFRDEIRHIRKQNSSVDFLMKDNIFVFSKNYLAITMIMSKCKFVVCGSGNCSIWIMFYRGNNKNVYQNYNGSWFNLETPF
jgi:hypothetical protein